MKYLVLLGAAAVGFLSAFGFGTREEIAADVDRRLDEDFVPQCAARAQFPAELADYKTEICGCMKDEFDARGYKLTDAFGDRRAEMRQITQDCASFYL